eukprot:1965710-Pyramimonas_sp.AAC.1
MPTSPSRSSLLRARYPANNQLPERTDHDSSSDLHLKSDLGRGPVWSPALRAEPMTRRSLAGGHT